MARRSLLFMPGNNPGMLTSSDILGADTLVFDLEDAVSLQEKDAARTLVREALFFLRFTDSEVTVRINPTDSPYWKEDLSQMVPARPQGIVIPKATASSVKLVEEEVVRLEHRYNLKEKLFFILIVESAWGLFDLQSTLKASDRIQGLILGGEDFTSDMGIKRTRDSHELLYARYQIATAARAYNLDAVDTPYTDIEDLEGLKEDTAFAKSIGFTGRLAINPRQVETLHEVFSPTALEIEEAESILLEAREAEKKGLGVFSYKGKMVDLPVIRRAERTMESARKWGLVR